MRCLLWLILTLPVYATNLQDFAGFSKEWLTCRHPGYILQWDLDRTGCVDLGDLELFAERWLEVSYPTRIQVVMSDGASPDYSGTYEYNGSPEGYATYKHTTKEQYIFPSLYGSVLEGYAFNALEGTFYKSATVESQVVGVYTAEAPATGTATVSEYTEVQSGPGGIEYKVGSREAKKAYKETKKFNEYMRKIRG